MNGRDQFRTSEMTSMEELVFASSSVDAGIGCWELHTGTERFRYKSCASPSNGLACIGDTYLVSSQIRQSTASSGSIFYWSWSKSQVGVKSFPELPINAVAANEHGTFIVGGGSKGTMYLWEVTTGRLLKKWHGHYRDVTCLVFYDNSTLISGSEDGSVKVWNLIRIFNDFEPELLHNFSAHTLRVTDIVVGCGGSSLIIISASEDRTCKVWSVMTGELLRDVVFQSKIDALALDPYEQVFYAGGRDGKIYVAALTSDSTSSKEYGKYITDAISNNGKAVTCLAYASGENVLLSGSEDGVVRVWDPKTHNTIRVLRHAKGPVNNIIVVKQGHSQSLSDTQANSRNRKLQLPPPLEKYEFKEKPSTIRVQLEDTENAPEASSFCLQEIEKMINETQQKGCAATEMEVEQWKHESKKAKQEALKWKKMCESLITEVLDGDHQ